MDRKPANLRLNALILVAAILLFLPTWRWLFDAWLSDPYYSHAPIVVILALYFAWVQHRVLTDSSPAPSGLGLLLLGAAFAVHLWATLWRAYYLSGLMIPLALLGLVVTLYGWRAARQLAFPMTFLVLMVPLPIAERFGPTLEGWTATTATMLAQVVGVAAYNVGSQVYLPNSTFTVGIPCGGLRSVIAIITLAALMAYILDGTRWARTLVFLAAIPIALAANTLRIGLLFVIANAWDAQAAMAYFHDWSSPVLFVGAFVLTMGLAKLLGCSQVRWEVVLPK